MAHTYTLSQLQGFRRVHQALTARAPEGDVQAWAEALGIDAFDTEVALECERLGVDYETFDQWAMDVDPETETLEAMGLFTDNPQA